MFSVEKWFCFEVKTAAIFNSILGIICSPFLIVVIPLALLIKKDEILDLFKEAGKHFTTNYILNAFSSS